MAKDEIVECYATSGFLLDGEHVERDEKLEIPETLFKELLGLGRVEKRERQASPKRAAGAGGAGDQPPK